VTSATAALPITLTPRLMRVLILSLLLAAGGYLGLALATGWDDTWRAVARVGAGGVAVGCGLTFAGFMLRFCRWQWYLGALGLCVDRLQSFVIYLSGFALTTTPGKVGELLRSAFLARHNVTYTQSFAAFFADRLTDLLSVVTLTMIGLSLYPKSRYGLWVLGVALLAVVVLIAAAPLLVEWGERGQNGWLTRTFGLGCPDTRAGQKLPGAAASVTGMVPRVLRLCRARPVVSSDVGGHGIRHRTACRDLRFCVCLVGGRPVVHTGWSGHGRRHGIFPAGALRCD
jgi:Lysylphosphatidylglycerol synthase TM region